MKGRMAMEHGRTREMLARLVDSIHAYAIFASDTEGNIVSWNVGARNLFGYRADEAIGKHSRMLFTKDDRLTLVPESELQTAREKGFAEDERWYLRKDGKLFFTSGIQTAIFDENRVLTGYAKIVRDLAERVELEHRVNAVSQDFEIKVVERTDELERTNNKLRTEVIERKRAEELRLAMMRKIVATQEKERKRIARDLHDEVGQQFTALMLKLNALATGGDEAHDRRRQIAELQSMANRINSSIDFLAWELRPSVLDDLGLPVAANEFVRDWSAHFGVPAEFHDVGMRYGRLLPEIEINLYRIIQEALNNISKHARAKRASVLLERNDGTIRLIVEDDGIGFGADAAHVSKLTDRGLGLIGMRERSELLGGKLEIESKPGGGTTIFVNVPVICPYGEPAAGQSETAA